MRIGMGHLDLPNRRSNRDYLSGMVVNPGRGNLRASYRGHFHSHGRLTVALAAFPAALATVTKACLFGWHSSFVANYAPTSRNVTGRADIR